MSSGCWKDAAPCKATSPPARARCPCGQSPLSFGSLPQVSGSSEMPQLLTMAAGLVPDSGTKHSQQPWQSGSRPEPSPSCLEIQDKAFQHLLSSSSLNTRFNHLSPHARPEEHSVMQTQPVG